MKKTTKIVSAAMATLMAASTVAVGSISASAASVKKPTKVKAVNVTKGIKISWKKVKGAKKYQVFRGKKKIKTVKKKTYTDKKAKAGKTYKYYVKAVKGKKKSKKSKAAKVVRLTKPTISSVKNAKNGATVTWKKVKGAKKYYVYTGSKKVGTATKLTYTYTKATSGKQYSYKVKAVNGKSTSVASAAKKGTFLSAPSVTYKIENGKVVLSWGKVNGAASYKVVKETIGNPGSKNIGSTTATTYTDDLGANPTEFAYGVYAVKGSNTSVTSTVAFIYYTDDMYFTDDMGNLHVKLALKKGETYAEGKYIAALISDSDYAVSVADEDSAKVVSVSGNVITAAGAGEGTIKVELKTDTAKNTIYNAVCAAIDKKFANTLSTGVVYVDVTVTE